MWVIRSWSIGSSAPASVKITPAHDFNDFAAGERHGLKLNVRIFDIHATILGTLLRTVQADPDVIQALEGLPAAKARAKVEALLSDRGLLEKMEPHKMALGKCYRCKSVVEPLLSDQWFVKIKPLAEPAIQAVLDGRIRMIPDTWTNNYMGWMRDIKDWCVSRQIWWGHRIPAWYCETCYGSSFLRRASDEPRSFRPTRYPWFKKPSRWHVPPVEANISSRIRMSLTPGFLHRCGPFQPWDGLNKRWN